MNLREIYEKRRSEGTLSTAAGTSGTSVSLRERYLEKQRSGSAEKVAKDIMNRANTWLKNHSNYMSNYRTHSASYNADAARRWQETVSAQRSNFVAESENIFSLLDQYGSYYDSEWVESVRSAITSGLKQQMQVTTDALKDVQNWNTQSKQGAIELPESKQQQITNAANLRERLSRVGSHTAELDKTYGDAKTNMERTTGTGSVARFNTMLDQARQQQERIDSYQRKYGGSSFEDAMILLDDMEDGEEKSWLENHALSKATVEDLTARRDAADNEDDYWKYQSWLNRKQIEDAARKLSSSKMAGGSGSVLDELMAVSKLEDGEEKKTRKTAVTEAMRQAGVDPDTYYSLITGDQNVTAGTVMDMLGSRVGAGVTSFGVAVSKLLDFTLGKAGRAIGWDNGLGKLAEDTAHSYNAYQYNAELYKNRMGGGTWMDILGDVTEGTVAAVPQALLALMSGGSSAGVTLSENAAAATGTILTKAGLTAKTVMRNPSYWLSFAQTFSHDFEEARAKGADELTASFGATISSLINAGIEIGFGGDSGIQGLPQKLSPGDSSAILEWAKSSLEEGGEEVLQGVVNNAVSKLLYDSDTKILDPKQAGQEFAMGTAVGGILGGGQIAVSAGANAAANAVNRASQNAQMRQAVQQPQIGTDASNTAQTSLDRQKPEEEEKLAAEKNNAAEGGYGVSADGKTILQKTGEAVVIREIASIKDGKMTLKLEDGRTVAADEVSYGSKDEALVYETLESMGVNASAANVLVNAYRAEKGVSASEYAHGIEEAYRYGQYNYPRQEIANAPFASALTEHQRNTAYRLGQLFGGKQVAKAQAAASQNAASGRSPAAGKVHFDGDRSNLTDRQSASISALETVADALGVQIHVFESQVDENGKHIGANGWYDTSDSSIHIDLHAGASGEGTMLFTAAHELTHFTKQWSPAKFKTLSNFLMEEYDQQGASVESLVQAQIAKAKGNGREIDYDTAYEEVIADSMEAMLSDGNVMEKLAKLKQRDKTLWQKVKDFITDLAGKIRSVYEGLSPDSAEGRYVAEMKGSIERLQEMFTEGLVDASKNYQAAEGQKNTTLEGGEQRYSLREFDDGTRFVDVQTDSHIFDGMTVAEMNQAVKPILMERFAGKVIGIDHRAFVNGDSVNEYLHPSKSIDMDTRKAKLTAAGELDNLLDAGKSLPNQPDGADGHIHPDAIDFSYYKTIFKVGNEYFEGIVNIKNIKRGKLLKDVTKIKNITQDIVSSYGQNPKSNFLRDASMDSIRKPDGNVNKKFSDRPYSYETLTGKPDMAVTTVEDNAPKNRADVVYMAKQNAAKVGTFDPKDGSVRVHVKDIGQDVVLSTNGLKHGLDRRLDINAAVTLKAGEILQNSIQINEVTPQKTEAEESYVLIGAAADRGGELYVVRSVVNRFSSELTSMDVLYAINAKKGNRLRSMRPGFQGPVTDSTVSIAELLDHVNQNFPDILPEDVLKHYGHDVRPEGKLGESALYQDRSDEAVSNRSLLANAFERVAQNDSERSKIREYQKKVEHINSEEEKLRNLKAQIKELSFATGPRDTAKIRALQDEATKTANRISNLDKMLLRLEATAPLKAVLEREKKAAYKRAEQKGKVTLEEYRQKAMQKQQETVQRYQESRAKGIESRNKTAMRHKVQNVVKELNQYLLKGTKDRHVPIELQKAVAEALDAVNMDTVGAQERIAKLKAELLNAKTPEKIQEISRKIDRVQTMGDRMQDKLQALKNGYDKFLSSDDPMVANSHDEVISAKLESVMESVGETSLRDMTVAQLEDVYDMYRMVLTTIRNTNKAFKEARGASIAELGTRVMNEVRATGVKKKLSPGAVEALKKFGWNNLKPVYAFTHIGSDTFTELFNNVRSGEDVWAVDVSQAREYYMDKARKYHYNDWNLNKQFRFTSASGMEFSLDVEQIMSLYAYSKREQAADHLRRGGIVIDESTEITVKTKLGIPVKFNPTEATAYNISDEILKDIVGKLTKEQKDFVDEMQEYLSGTMGEKGNEVSLELYGIKLFKEKNYFPLKSARQFMAKAKEQQQGEGKIKNFGFSKETVKKASNPIVLTPFMNVWAGHVNEMSMYHAFVLAMEDFYRVYNYATATSDTAATESVEMFIQNAYGKGATGYIDQLLRDLNGGARTDPTAGFINKAMGLFKKGAVFASLSVVVQQPSSIARAAALVDTKYFIGPKLERMKQKELWDEVKQYAPVAVIKEMGYFDTNMGKSTQDFIMGKEYSGFREKMTALVKDSSYRDEILSKAPALADEMAWCSIWEAVKRETMAKNPGMDAKSQAFLQKAGERFTEVIVKTQVYDSVLSRSANMRSKDTGMKMATSFMAEPTTSINMIADALLQGKRGNRKYARTAIGAVIASQIVNSVLVSFVYAGRDDDENKTYLEKYLGTLTAEVLDSLNPAAYIPFVKDIVSIVQGYDVERSDMAVVSDLWNGWQKLDSSTLSPYRKVESFAGSVAQLFGLPVKNIMRDARGIYQTVMSFMNGQKTTGAGIGYAVREAVTGKAVSDRQQLYEAYLSGDQTQIARVEGRYNDQSAISSAMRAAVKEHYLAEDIPADTAKAYLVHFGGMEADAAFWKLQEWDHEKENGSGDDYSKYEDLYSAVQTGKGLKATIRTYTDNGVSEETLRSQISGYFKPLYIAMNAAQKANIKGYLLNALEACGLDREAGMEKLAEWEFESQYPDIAARISYSAYKNWAQNAKGSVSLEVFAGVAEFKAKGSKDQEAVADYINGLELADHKKDVLWCCFYSANTLKNAPWRK